MEISIPSASTIPIDAKSRLQRSFSTIPRTYSAPQDPAVITSQPVHPLASARQPRPIRDNSMLRKAQRERLSEKLIKMDLVPKAEDQAKMQEDVEHSILGAAGPYTVVGSNFAPGTTAADIESAMAPHGGEMLGCQITSHRPTVVAEMVYAEKARGENIIATFNNKRVCAIPVSSSAKLTPRYRPMGAFYMCF